MASALVFMKKKKKLSHSHPMNKRLTCKQLKLFLAEDGVCRGIFLLVLFVRYYGQTNEKVNRTFKLEVLMKTFFYRYGGCFDLHTSTMSQVMHYQKQDTS